ncbi:MAG: hypothetical protein Q9225_000619 [Loekoesia sp. 1 TL-2023]
MQLHLCVLLVTAALLHFAHTQENTVWSGHYAIRYCGSGIGSKTARLQALLPHFWDYLEQVLIDVQKGTSSKAYRAFFKTQGNAARVENIFRRMANGDNVLILGNGPILTRLLRPSILCLDPSIPNWEGLKAVCDLGSPPATTVPNRELVVLCPGFWEMDEGPDYSECPRMRRNKFGPNDHRVMYNMFGTFVHEFAHAYLGNWGTNETYKVMDAAELSAEVSLKNANNYALYAAMVAAKCKKFVNPDLFHNEERILQEISLGVTSDLAALSSSIAAAEASGSIDSPPNDSTVVTQPSLAAPMGNDILPTSLAASIPPATNVSPPTTSPTTTASPVINFRRKIGGGGTTSTSSI